jgi:hypothetical protein
MNVNTNIAAIAAAVQSSTPWVEKYRPKTFDNIVLDETNKTILENDKNKHSGHDAAAGNQGIF